MKEYGNLIGVASHRPDGTRSVQVLEITEDKNVWLDGETKVRVFPDGKSTTVVIPRPDLSVKYPTETIVFRAPGQNTVQLNPGEAVYVSRPNGKIVRGIGTLNNLDSSLALEDIRVL